MPLWIVSTAGSGIETHWNQPPSSSRLTRRPASAAWTSMMMVACEQAEPLGQHDAGLREPLIVGLKAGQDQVELLVLHRGRQRRGHGEGVGAARRSSST